MEIFKCFIYLILKGYMFQGLGRHDLKGHASVSHLVELKQDLFKKNAAPSFHKEILR